MKNQSTQPQGNRDAREKSRQLSSDEERRLASFESLSADMLARGYRREELTVSIVRANVFAVVLLIPLLVLGFGLFLLKNDSVSLPSGPMGTLLLFLLFFVLIVVHELIHGMSWAIFTEHHWKDISFGFMKQYLTPYCSCAVPLKKGQYIFGALMPLLVLGLVPMLVGILTGSLLTLLLGVMLADGAAGDILIVWKILRYRSAAKEVVYIDHPTQAGGVIFER